MKCKCGRTHKSHEDKRWVHAHGRKPFFYYWSNVAGQQVPMYKMPVKDDYVDAMGETLLKEGYAIPPTPDFKTWKNSQGDS